MEKILDYPELKTVLDAYQAWTPSTAIYLSTVEEQYLISGLAAEIFEASAAHTGSEHFWKEIGDIFWFISQIGNMFGFLMSEAPVYRNIPICNHFEKFFSVYAKCYRKNYTYDILVESLRIPYYGMVNALLDDVHNTCSKSLASLLQDNHDKLESRKARGTIEGSGENR